MPDYLRAAAWFLSGQKAGPPGKQMVYRMLALKILGGQLLHLLNIEGNKLRFGEVKDLL
ncbi:MAG: hypothetical protein ACO1QB_18740 [Verrucomicrobiales bacterium]